MYGGLNGLESEGLDRELHGLEDQVEFATATRQTSSLWSSLFSSKSYFSLRAKMAIFTIVHGVWSQSILNFHHQLQVLQPLLEPLSTYPEPRLSLQLQLMGEERSAVKISRPLRFALSLELLQLEWLLQFLISNPHPPPTPCFSLHPSTRDHALSSPFSHFCR